MKIEKIADVVKKSGLEMDMESVAFAEELIRLCSRIVFYGDPSDSNRLKIGRELCEYFGVENVGS
jgi:hypothetical protein